MVNVKIYTTVTCPWCKKLKDWLKRRKIAFEEYDLSESQNDKYRDELLEKTSQLAVPVIEINGQIIIGFKEEEIEAAVKKAKS